MKTGLAVVYGLGLIFFAISGVFEAGAEPSVAAPHPSTSTTLTWHYEGEHGPSHWGAIAPTTASCENGTHQSPINIRTTPHASSVHDELLIHYHPSTAKVVTSHHTIEVDFQSGGALEIFGRR